VPVVRADDIWARQSDGAACEREGLRTGRIANEARGRHLQVL
jgi:hypothetical protein